MTTSECLATPVVHAETKQMVKALKAAFYGVSRCRKHLGNDGNRYPRLPKDLAPENAEPNPDTGRDGGCDCLHPKPARSSLRRPGLSRLMARVQRVGADFASSTTKIGNRWRLVPGIPG